MNHGVILGQRETDYVGGTLPFEERNPSGEWTQYLPVGERQYSNPGGGDSMSCVSFSAINSIEIQEKFLTGRESNYSDRWTAKMSDTTPEGNYLWKVADTIRKQGLIPQEMYSYPPTPWTFNQFHAPIPEPLYSRLLAKGSEWLSKWDVAYEWIEVTKEPLLKHLKHAPLQMVIPGHAVVGFLCRDDVLRYFDTYEHGSTWTVDKPISAYTHAMKIVLTPKNYMNEHVRIINYKGTIYIGVGAKDIPQAQALGEAFGRRVEVNEKGEITNADIVV
jgi:hypothetical protein